MKTPGGSPWVVSPVGLSAAECGAAEEGQSEDVGAFECLLEAETCS